MERGRAHTFNTSQQRTFQRKKIVLDFFGASTFLYACLFIFVYFVLSALAFICLFAFSFGIFCSNAWDSRDRKFFIVIVYAYAYAYTMCVCVLSHASFLFYIYFIRYIW